MRRAAYSRLAFPPLPLRCAIAKTPASLLGLVVLCAVLPACSPRATHSIQEVYDNIHELEGQKLRLRGQVSWSTNASPATQLLDALDWGALQLPERLNEGKFYLLEDSTGRIVVLPQTENIPPNGQEVLVEGVVEQVFNLGKRQLLLLRARKHLDVE